MLIVARTGGIKINSVRVGEENLDIVSKAVNLDIVSMLIPGDFGHRDIVSNSMRQVCQNKNQLVAGIRIAVIPASSSWCGIAL